MELMEDMMEFDVCISTISMAMMEWSGLCRHYYELRYLYADKIIMNGDGATGSLR